MSEIKLAKLINGNNDDEDDFYGSRQALPVNPIPVDFDPSIPPTSGEEYLQHVVFESKRLPKVVCASRFNVHKNDTHCDPNIISLRPSLAPSHLAPDEKWQQFQVEKFEKLRHRMHSLRLSGEIPFDRSLVPDVEENDSVWEQFLLSNQPLLTVVLPLHQRHLERILPVLLKVKPGDHLWQCYGSWIYAVCACVEHPLSREAYGELRDIARKCSQIRKTKVDPEDKEVTMLNLIITLVVKYFRQYDLAA